jgi:PST family polysaccharide transporter
LGTRLTWYGWSNADFFVAGKVLNTAALGVYTLAWTLATVSIEKITGLVVTVTPSFFAAAQSDRALLRDYFLTLTSTIAMLTIPISAGMALVASDLVPSILGSQWLPAVRPLVGLSIYAAFGSLTPLLSSVLRVTGDQRFSLQMSLWGLIVMPLTFYVGSQWGPAGIAYGWLVAYPIIAIPQYVRVFARLSLSLADYWRSLCPAVTCTALMVFTVAMLRHILPLAPGVPRLVFSIACGVVTYGCSFAVLYRKDALTIWRRTGSQDLTDNRSHVGNQ